MTDDEIRERELNQILDGIGDISKGEKTFAMVYKDQLAELLKLFKTNKNKLEAARIFVCAMEDSYIDGEQKGYEAGYEDGYRSGKRVNLDED